MPAYSPEGSVWRKWDLHVHTRSSYDASKEYNGDDAEALLIESWKRHGISAVAITDHFLIDSKRISKLKSLAQNEITIFPGVELRTDKGASNVHVILIFPETLDITQLESDFKSEMIRLLGKENTSPEKIYWDYQEIVKFAKASHHRAIISIHAGRKANGLDKEITNSLEVAQAIKAEYAQTVDAFELGNVRDIADYNDIVFKQIERKPLFICSDNHNPKKYEIKEYLWIKADLTFEGLLQTTLHPEERVFIGATPPKIDISSKNKKSYIKSLEVKKSATAKHHYDNWFDFSLKINPGLVAIIGNKGSGKSALADIIGQLCKCKNMSEASFLNTNRFRKAPKSLAKDYDAILTWLDDQPVNDNLNNSDYGHSIENATYLPQKFIENVCNELGNEFEDEINKAIFTYIDPLIKGSTLTLKELLDNKSVNVRNEIDYLKKKINEKNEAIIALEDRLCKEYKDTIEKNIAKLTDDLKRHQLTKPKEVTPSTILHDDTYKRKLKEIEDELEKIDNEINDSTKELSLTIKQCDEIDKAIYKITDLERSSNELNLALDSLGTLLNLPEGESLKVKVSSPLSFLQSKSKELNERKSVLTTATTSMDAEDASLLLKKFEIDKRRKDHISQSTEEEQAYQKYCTELKEWQEKESKIVGDENTPETLAFYSNELNNIANVYPEDYSAKKNERTELITLLFAQKDEIVKIYEHQYDPVRKKLDPILEGKDDELIEFEISKVLGRSDLAKEIHSFINKNITGHFQYQEKGEAALSNLVKSTIFSDLTSVLKFIDEIFADIYDYPDSIKRKVTKRLDYYNFICSMDYIEIKFILKLGGRVLEELSPGEKGIVLLVFYLALSREESPLIIDQPEDNLDNQSVYYKLVPCIREAKKSRQVIMVTHNPNIAIACDAEQIVYCQINKKDNHITYESGGIENPTIKKHVVDVLEGTMPAFTLRRIKYSHEFSCTL